MPFILTILSYLGFAWLRYLLNFNLHYAVPNQIKKKFLIGYGVGHL